LARSGAQRLSANQFRRLRSLHQRRDVFCRSPLGNGRKRAHRRQRSPVDYPTRASLRSRCSAALTTSRCELAEASAKIRSPVAICQTKSDLPSHGRARTPVRAEPGPERLAGDCEPYQMRAVLRRRKCGAEDCPLYQSRYVFVLREIAPGQDPSSLRKRPAAAGVKVSLSENR